MMRKSQGRGVSMARFELVKHLVNRLKVNTLS
jgi:hypothetical protein